MERFWYINDEIAPDVRKAAGDGVLLLDFGVL